MPRRHAVSLVAACAALALALGAAGCTSPKPVDTTEVSIKDNHYVPAVVKGHVAVQIKWTNEDSVAHTMTNDDGPTPNQNLAPGQSFYFTPGEKTEIRYHCAIHNFKGKIVIE